MTAAITAAQLEFPIPATPALNPAETLAMARAAVDLNRRPGFAEFTKGVVTVEQVDSDRVVLATDNRWAATAIRSALRCAGLAIEADPGNETCTVIVWAIGKSDSQAVPELKLTEQSDRYGRAAFLLDGPDGAIEQQCGSGGHNDLIVHAQHPFPGAMRGDCDRHGPGCWRRSSWPVGMGARRFIRSAATRNGLAWQPDPKATWRMRSIYRRYVHQTRTA